MKKEELQEALKQLEEQGWNPMICDTPVPLFDAGVKCGIPNDVGDIVRQYASLPHEMVSLNTEFTITVKGDSHNTSSPRCRICFLFSFCVSFCFLMQGCVLARAEPN